MEQRLDRADVASRHMPQDVIPSGLQTIIHRDHSAGLRAYTEFCRQALHAGCQNPIWVQGWLSGKCDDECLIAEIRKNGRPALALALEVRKSGPFTIASFPGGPHATSAFAPATGEELSPEDLYSALHDIHAARPDIDAIALKRQRQELDGMANPLLQMPHIISPNLTFAVRLEPYRESRIIGSRSRMSRHRSRRRKFEAHGEIRIVEARTPEEVDLLLDHFLRWKAEQLKSRGIANSFAPEEVKTGLRHTFHRALGEEQPSYFLCGLEVGGQLRAVNGYSRSPEGPLCEFLAYANDEVAHFAPGEFLTYEMVVRAYEGNAPLYDFGVGDEPHKRIWCDLIREEFDTYVGFTPKGKMLALGLMATEILKRFIKRNPRIFRLASRLRRAMAGHKSRAG